MHCLNILVSSVWLRKYTLIPTSFGEFLTVLSSGYTHTIQYNTFLITKEHTVHLLNETYIHIDEKHTLNHRRIFIEALINTYLVSKNTYCIRKEYQQIHINTY